MHFEIILYPIDCNPKYLSKLFRSCILLQKRGGTHGLMNDGVVHNE